MARKLMQGLLMVSALVLPAGNALAFCMEGDVMECRCPDGSYSFRYCINARFGPCECGGAQGEGASVSNDELAAQESAANAEAAQVCAEASTPAQAPASTQG
ncbi:hypothetical protein ACLESD_40260 [Pyxidicoccus sp. 3LFB2]